MSRALIVRRCGANLTVQDQGSPGHLGQGLSRGGAADRAALAEGAALLGQSDRLAAIEMAGSGGEFEATADLRIALTGAPMRAEIDGRTLAWNASHALPLGSRLAIGGALQGNFGYLHVGGGIESEPILGSRSTHLSAGLGRALCPGDILPVGSDRGADDVGFCLDPAPRFDGGSVRVVPSLQTDLFPVYERLRFETAQFSRDTRSNRMGVRLLSDGPGYACSGGLSVLSEVTVPGDIQVTGDGTPVVLMAECQTTGGYPRIGTVIPADLPRVAQAGHGTALRFSFISLEAAVDIERAERARLAGGRGRLRRLVRRLEDIPDLLAYQLIGGVTAGDDLEVSRF